VHLFSLSLLQRHELAQLVNRGGASTIDAQRRTPGWWQVAGAAVVLYGSVHQFNCHRILAGMGRAGGRQRYRRPAGDWFDLVPYGHYLVRPPCLSTRACACTDFYQAEVVIYSGLAVMSACSDTSVRHGIAAALPLQPSTLIDCACIAFTTVADVLCCGGKSRGQRQGNGALVLRT
jgi:hypothetical protein